MHDVVLVISGGIVALAALLALPSLLRSVVRREVKTQVEAARTVLVDEAARALTAARDERTMDTDLRSRLERALGHRHGMHLVDTDGHSNAS